MQRKRQSKGEYVSASVEVVQGSFIGPGDLAISVRGPDHC